MEGKNKILIIKSGLDDFEKYYNKGIQDYGITVWLNDEIHCSRMKNFLLRQMDVVYRMYKMSWLKNIKNYEKIIVFEDYSLIPWLFLFKKKQTRLILWKWNAGDEYFSNRVEQVRKYCEPWTFDERDAKRYGWKLNYQFFFSPVDEETIDIVTENIDKGSIFFVGRDKGRYSQLKQIYEHIIYKDMIPDFWMVKDKSKQYGDEDSKWIKESEMLYSETIEHLLRCDAILDLVKDGQTGYTVRVLEAIFLGKKLITNNKEIMCADIYSRNNIFVIGCDSWEDLEEFIRRPYQKVQNSILEKYRFESWIKRFDER